MLSQFSTKTWMFIIIVCTHAHSLFAQPDTLWTRAFGGDDHEVGFDVQQTTDGGFIVAGYTVSFSIHSGDLWLVRTDSSGETLWTRTFGGNRNDIARSVQQTSDGGFIVAGYANSFGAGDYDLWLIRTDASGDTLWTRTFGGDYDDVGYSVQQTSDGGFIMAGHTKSFGAGDADLWLLRTNASGDTLWTRTFGGNTTDVGYSVQQTSDGGFIVTGYTHSFGAGNYDLWLVRTDSSGDTLWTRTYGGNKLDRGYSVQQTSDGGFIMTGDTDPTGLGRSNLWLIRTDSSGDTLWTRTFGGHYVEIGYSVQQTSDGGFIATGTTNSFGAGDWDLWLFRTDSYGDTLWTRTFGGISIDKGYAVQQTSDGGYIVTGYTQSFGPGSKDLWLIRLDAYQVRLTVGTAYAAVGDTVDVPVLVNFPGRLSASSAQISISGYSEFLNFIEIDTSNCLSGAAGWNYQVYERNGLLTLDFGGSQEISGEGELLTLRFSIPRGRSSYIPININSAQFDQQTIPIKTTAGGIYVNLFRCGDVSLDGKIQPFDAALILKYLSGYIELNEPQSANADVSLSRTITALDASLILQYTVGIIDTLPYPTSQLNAAGNITMINGALAPGQTVEVPLFLSNGENILSFEGLITYDPQHLTFREIAWPQNFSDFIREINARDGEIRITGANIRPHDSSDGFFATLRFTVNENSEATETIVTLSRLRWNEEPVMENVASATLSTVTGSAGHRSGIPEEFALNQNYPNPFNPTTTISYQVPEAAFVTLEIYNVKGQLVETLVNENKPAGYHSVTWDASSVSSGLVIFKIKAGGYSEVKKGLFLR